MLAWWLGLLGFLLLISEVYTEENKQFNLKFQQNDYNLTMEWVEVARFNKYHYKQFELVTFKFNRTCTALNLTYTSNIDLRQDTEIISQLYKFASNEYRLFPIRFEVSFCTAINKNLAGLHRFYDCGNFTSCSALKDRGTHICNFTPDPSQLPPYIPSGRYKAELQGLFHNEETFLVNAYAEVSRPFIGK